MRHWSHWLHISKHSLDKFRLNKFDATYEDLAHEVIAGEEISKGVARPLLGRFADERRYASLQDRYLLAADRKGLFVLNKDKDGRTVVVTYIYFLPSQESFVLKHWPLQHRKSEQKPNLENTHKSIEDLLDRRHPIVGRAARYVKISARLREIFGSTRKAQTAIARSTASAGLGSVDGPWYSLVCHTEEGDVIYVGIYNDPKLKAKYLGEPEEV